MSCYTHLNFEDRKKIKAMLDKGISASKIAETLEKHPSTVYREIKRGNDGISYNPELAEKRYQITLSQKGEDKKIQSNPELAQFISDCIILEGLSPEQIALRTKTTKEFEGISISKTSIYNAIDSGLIPKVNKETLQHKKIKVFSNGLIVLPVWVRNKLSIKDGDIYKIEICDDNSIKLSK